jgi:pyrroloquinoline quinone (PQQ) biosynthesis protein C
MNQSVLSSIAKPLRQPGAVEDHQVSDDPIKALAQSVYASSALNNEFYDLWTSQPLNARQVAVFARNYGEFNRAFPEVLSVMISSTRDVYARTEYAKTLFSEMGYGVVEKAHSNLFDAWLRELGKKLGEPDTLIWENIAQNLTPLPETFALIEGEKRMYGSDNATGSGAQLALEWQAYTMLRKMYDGATLYKPLWNVDDQFHEACEYFYAHIGAAEKEHKIESLNGARQFHVDSNSRLRIERGFRTHLDLFGAFWNAIVREIVRVG